MSQVTRNMRVRGPSESNSRPPTSRDPSLPSHLHNNLSLDERCIPFEVTPGGLVPAGGLARY